MKTAARCFRRTLSAVFRLCGQFSTAPRGVPAQSIEAISWPIAPPPSKMDPGWCGFRIEWRAAGVLACSIRSFGFAIDKNFSAASGKVLGIGAVLNFVQNVPDKFSQFFIGRYAVGLLEVPIRTQKLDRKST